MAKYAYAERVVNKLRRLLRHDKRVVDLLGTMPTVFLDSGFNLSHLMWACGCQRIVVNCQGVLYDTTDGVHENMLQFNGFDGLLSMRS